MINRNLYYFKNIKLNPFVNKTIANESKKKYTNYKQKQTIYHTTIRHFSSYNYLPPNMNIPPPDYHLCIMSAIALIGGLYYKFNQNKTN